MNGRIGLLVRLDRQVDDDATDAFDPDRIDRSLKTLYATGLFQDVRLRRVGDTLVVRVVENPVVNRVAFEGNKKVQDNQELDSDSQSGDTNRASSETSSPWARRKAAISSRSPRMPWAWYLPTSAAWRKRLSSECLIQNGSSGRSGS